MRPFPRQSTSVPEWIDLFANPRQGTRALVTARWLAGNTESGQTENVVVVVVVVVFVVVAFISQLNSPRVSWFSNCTLTNAFKGVGGLRV